MTLPATAGCFVCLSKPISHDRAGGSRTNAGDARTDDLNLHDLRYDHKPHTVCCVRSCNNVYEGQRS